MKCLKVVWIIFSVTLTCFSSFTVLAQERSSDFRVEPIFSKSQIGNQGYYHFKGNKGDTVNLQARVINDSEKRIKVSIRSLNAYSGNQGILYQDTPTLAGTSITDEDYQFNKAVTNPTEIILGPLESKVVEFTLNIPAISGTLLGSMEFKVFQGTDEVSKKEENSQLLIDRYKAINIGVQVDITNYQETPSLILDKPFFSPDQISIMIPMRNNHPVIVPNISGSYTITKKEDSNFSLAGDILLFKMAPMSNFHYSILWSDGKLETGHYNVNVSLNVNDDIQTYNQSFSIENEELIETEQKMKERGVVEIVTKPFPWTLILIGFLLVFIAILLLMIKRAKSPQRRKRKYPGQDQ